MAFNNFRKGKALDNRPKYLRYDDVFMSKNSPTKTNSYNQNGVKQEDYKQKPPHFSNDSYEPYEENEYADDFEQYESSRNDEYFSRQNNIIDEKMIRFQKRRLPPLQGYSEFNGRSIRSRAPLLSSWEAEEEYKSRFNKKRSVFGNVFQKFIVAFTSILSLVCLSWIAYNWNNGTTKNSISSQNPITIEPEQDDFKVLPENPGGENIPHKDKMVYEKISPGNSYIEQEENLLPPQEEPVAIKPPVGNYRENIEEYSIIDDKIYYIKISAGKDKAILESEIKLLKKKFKNVMGDKSCSIKKVSDAQGERKYAILIGPFETKETAAYTAQELGGQCYIISVKE